MAEGESVCNLWSADRDKSNKSRHQEMRDNFEIMKIDRRKCHHKKIILHSLNKCLAENSDLSEELKDKVRNLLLTAEVDACMNLGTKDSEQKLLGLSDINNEDVSYNEQEKINRAVHNKLKSFQTACMNPSTNLTKMSEDTDIFHLNIFDKNLHDARKKLNDIQTNYMENLKVFYNLLEDFLQLRFKNVEELVRIKLDEYSIKSKMYDLRSEMIKEKTRLDIFHESSISFLAYEKFLNGISEQQKECQKQINDVVALKGKYELVACREYDEILRCYLECKTSLERKRDLYKQLKDK